LNTSRRGVMRARGGHRAGWIGVLFAFGLSVSPAWCAPVLFEGAGTWAALTGLPEEVRPPAGEWALDSGVWVGRIPPGTTTLTWGDAVLETASAIPPPPPAIQLPILQNPFGKCLIRSLSVRYDKLVRSRKWSLVFDKEGEEPDFIPIALPVGPEVRLVLEMEDAVTGERWKMLPTRHGREGGIFSLGSDARVYAGTVDQGDLDWNLLVVPTENGRVVLQGRVLVMKSASRLVRFRVMIRSDVPGQALLQKINPPAVFAVGEGRAVGLFPDLAEPRRFRAVGDVPEQIGLEFDLAVTKATGNFPQTATVSLELDAWETSSPESAEAEAVSRLARLGGGLPVPESIRESGVPPSAVVQPDRIWLSPPGGSRSPADAMAYLLLKTSGLFPDPDWSASAFMCAAQDAEGESRAEAVGSRVVVAVNPDPDLKTLLEMGPNRGQAVLSRIRQSKSPAVWIRASADSLGLDYNSQALFLCDYPAVWTEGIWKPGVDLRHAEAELLASLACVLKQENICLLVSDAGPMAPFTTLHADALVCESTDPQEMKRQHALAGSRPVLWAIAAATPAAEAVAQDLKFVRIPQMKED